MKVKNINLEFQTDSGPNIGVMYSYDQWNKYSTYQITVSPNSDHNNFNPVYLSLNYEEIEALSEALNMVLKAKRKQDV